MQTPSQTHPKGPRIDDFGISESPVRWLYAEHGLGACLTFRSSAPAARELSRHLQELYLNFIRVYTAKK